MHNTDQLTDGGKEQLLIGLILLVAGSLLRKFVG